MIPRRLVKIMGPLWCGSCGCRLTAGDPRHPDHGPVTGPTPGCRVCSAIGGQGGVTEGDSYAESQAVTLDPRPRVLRDDDYIVRANR